MRLDERLRLMREQRVELVGKLIKDEANRQGYISKASQAEFFHYSESSVQTRLFHGNVPSTRLRNVEGILKLPVEFFDLVIAGDIPALERLDMGDMGHMRQRAIAGLKSIADGMGDVEINGEV